MSRTAFITGATSEIGQSIIKRIVGQGVDCAITARRDSKLAEIADGFADSGQKVIPFAADMTVAEEREEVLAKTKEQLAAPDIFIYVAAGSVIKPILEFPAEDWHNDFAVNVDAPFFLAQMMTPDMRDRGWGRIITIGSVYASYSANPHFYEGKWPADTPAGPVRNGAYMASKGALKMLTRDMAAMYGPWGITANMVSPGMIEIGDRPMDPDFRARFTKMTPVGRMGKPDDISNAVAFLAKEESSFITGSDVVVDGGWTIW